MLRRTFLGLAAASSLLCGCSVRRRRENEVFASYLKALAGPQSFPGGLPLWDQPFVAGDPNPGSIALVVASRTKPVSPHNWKSIEAICETLPKVQRSAAADLMSRDASDEPVTLSAASLPPRIDVELVPPGVLQKMFGQPGDLDDRWAEFHRRYPRASGIAAFSSVGFSADGNQAVFMFERSCGSLCGTGHAVLMRRIPTGWMVMDHRSLWVS